MEYEIRVTRPDVYVNCPEPNNPSCRQGHYFMSNVSILQCIIYAARDMPDEKLDMQYWDRKDRHGELIVL